MSKQASTKHQRITKGLLEIGACWAVRSDKYVDTDNPLSRPTYHIHPDSKSPWQSAIRRFYSLDEIADYIRVQKEARALNDPVAAMNLIEQWEASREV